jgi:predicted permease
VSFLSDLFERVRTLVFRRREERELEEELRFHLEMDAAQRERAGVSSEEAARLARASLGGVEWTKEEVRDARGTRLVDDTRADLAYAFRTLRRTPRFTIVAVLTLAVGIGGTAAVFSAVDRVLLAPLPYADPGQLVRLTQYAIGRPDYGGYVTGAHYREYRQRLGAASDLAATYTYDEDGADIGTGDAAHRIHILPVTASYFGVLRAQPIIGRAFEPNEETGAPLVIVSHDLWRDELSGEPRAIGRSLLMSGKSYTVVGVMPPDFVDPIAGNVDAWVPIDATTDWDSRGNHFLTVIGRLASGVTYERAQAELDALSLALVKEFPDDPRTRARLTPLKENTVGAASRTLEILLGAVALVLLLVCVNVANLLLVRGSERVREMALRSALGAGHGRIVRQLLIESVVLAIGGGLAGLLVARAAMAALVSLAADSIPRLAGVSIDPRVLVFSLVVSSLSAIVFGFAPALRAARVQPADALREYALTTTGSIAHGRLRSALVVAQVSLALVLTVGAGLLIASMNRLRQVDLGIRPERVLAFQLNLPSARYDSTARARVYQDVTERFSRMPGVRAAGAISKLPATGMYHIWAAGALSGPLANTDRAFAPAQQRVIEGDYFRAVGIPLLAGRLFDARDDAAAPYGVIISRSLAQRLFPGIEAVGQQVQVAGHPATVIGVVGDVAITAEGEIDSHVYHSHRQFAGRHWALTQVIATAGDPDAMRGAIRRELNAIDPQLVMFRPTSLEDAIGRGVAQRRFTLAMLGAFAAVALLLAALGLFGVLSYAVKLRGREIGIRLALGADGGAIRRMVLGQGLRVTALGIAIGLAGAAGMSKVMASLVFRVSPLQPGVLAGATGFMLAVAMVAAYLPARRATKLDPRAVLQGE